MARLRDSQFGGRSLCREAADEIERLRTMFGQTIEDLQKMYVALVRDADLMRQLVDTHPLKQIIRSVERIYLGRTEG